MTLQILTLWHSHFSWWYAYF